MTVNATTGVDPEVDRFAIYDTGLAAYINLTAKWPRPDGGPIVGGNPSLQYYKRTTIERPDADHRYTVATEWNRVDASPTPPEGYPVGTYQPLYEVNKLSTDDLKSQVDTAFQQYVRDQFPAVGEPARLLLAAGALARRQDGATLTTYQAALIEAIKGNEDAIAQLETRRKELYAAIDADKDYDLTEWPQM